MRMSQLHPVCKMQRFIMLRAINIGGSVVKNFKFVV